MLRIIRRIIQTADSRQQTAGNARRKPAVRRLLAAVFFITLAWGSVPALAGNIVSADLQIQGAGLRVVTIAVGTGIDIPASIQTEFGGKQNDDAPTVEGLIAAGDLTGPGIDTPIRLETAPGHRFQIPALSRKGTYLLQNIRLIKDGEFLQPATPSVATITVSELLVTEVKVRQLTPEELRARGISIDDRNFEVYEYTFSFFVDGKIVEIPFPVIIDKRTHEVREIAKEEEYKLPPVTNVTPPRWSPPAVAPFELGPGADFPSEQQPDREKGSSRPSIPAALVIPNSLGVLHQFFAVTLMVTNGAPQGSSVVLDSVNALIKTPAELRTVKSLPPVAFNQAVPIVDPTTGATFLVAQAQGSAEWSVEGLKPGTHTLEVEVHATYKSPGQADFPLKGTVRATIVVHDPRFNINFSHPDTVRKGIDYSTYSFITNMSGVPQTIHVTNVLQACSVNPTANVCRLDETPEFVDLTIPAGEMRMVEYKLRPNITGHVFASAGSVSDDNITASVQLFMGVSESGIPLSPVTLVMPYYARYVSQDLISPNLQLLGLGYSLATAPLTQALAKHPRVIKTDVFERAVDIARAGQRIFLGEDTRDSMAHMSLDLLGNSLELREWDDLRRQEKSGRIAGASVARELEKGADDINAFVTRFASTTAHRGGYTLAVVQGPAELSVKALPSGATMSVANEAAEGWLRNVPYGDLSRFRNGQIAMVGRWGSALELGITPSATGSISLDVIYPNTTDGSLLRAHVDINGTAGKKLTLTIDRGNQQLSVRDDVDGIAAVPSVTTVQPEPIHLIGARQDMHLDEEGHKVSVLFSRPVKIADGDDWLKKFHGHVHLNKDGVNYNADRPMSAAALQGDSRVVNVTFDHALSQNATYTLDVDPVLDPLTDPHNYTSVTFPQPLVPVIDNDKPGGIIYGHVFKGDNTAIPNAEVVLRPEGAPQYDLSASDGSFLFEFVPRDIDNNIAGTYLLQAITTEGKETKIQGAVRLPGRVHFVNLVFLGRGSAQGYVRYDNGEAVKNAHVVVGSTMFDQFRSGDTDANGFYSIEDLPVGPLTFSATDADGNVTYGASEIKTPGQVLVKDLSIYRRPFPGVATVRGIVMRSDTNTAVAGAHIGVFSQGYGLMDGYTDSAGRFEFNKVPAGFITVLASEWSISLQSVAIDFDIAADETRDVTLTLNVAPNLPLAQIEGDVQREDPLHPGDAAFYQNVAGALVKIDNGQAVVADANGHYILQPVPVSFSGHTIRAYDPATKRTAEAVVPTLDPTKINKVPVFISTASGYGHGSIRVRVYSAGGFPISGLRVLVPGFPPTVLPETGSGIYTLSGVPVGASMNIWAISTGGTYGDQFAQGTAKVEFDGHVASLNFRFAGQGLVRVKLVADIDVIGDVKISYPVWDEEEQGFGLRERTVNSAVNGVADYAVFDKVPAVLGYNVASTHPVYGFAGASGKLGFDGDVQSITLQLNKLSTVRGFVYAIDGQTPVAGAIVRIEDGRQNQGTYATLPDGSFVFFNEPANTSFRVVAEITQDGTYRTGYANGVTPQLGGPVNNVRVLMRTQGSVDGKIVYSGFKRYDPLNPANNIIDDTPNDLSDNAAVPLARYQLREFDFPGRAFGSSLDPLTADIQGQFTINNLFTGPFRVDASDPNNQENRGSFTGTLSQEGERLRVYVPIGVIGFGSVTISVTDPNNLGAAVYNAEVSIYRGSSVFDLTTTDGNGLAHFDQLPVGTYSATAFSKALGRSGSTVTSFAITVNTDTSVRIQLVFSGKVTGRLTDPEKGGLGVPGAPVTLTAFNYSTRTSTEVSGDFLFEGVREGLFALDAKDTLSNRRAHATHALSQADPQPVVPMELERTETLYVSVYLPDDAGGNSNILAPLVNLDVTQRNNEFMRSMQGNSFQMPQLFRDWPYSGLIREVGGQQREIRFSGTFPNGDSAHPIKLVFPAYGNVEVRVNQAGVPAANARVTVSGGGRSVTIYTDAAGVALANGIGLGQVYVQAVTVDGAFSGSASATLASQSTAVVVPITLGAFAGVTGYVEAELGGPSVNTRVIASFGRTLEIFTDSTGHYTFQGIPTNTTVNLVYMGPDDVTVGARQSYAVKLADASRLITLGDVKLDATPPTLRDFFPADGAQNVSPDSSLRFTFSEAIGSQYINNTYFQLVPADSSQQLNCTFTPVNNQDGTFTVTMRPPPTPPGETFPLKSNTLYRVIVSGEIRDLTGNKMPATRGGSFITSDYAEPHVTKTTPNVSQPLQAATTLVFTFNEPIDATQWQPNGGGQFHFYKLSAPGAGGSIVAEKAGHAFVDPATGLTLNFAPNDPIEQQSFYRVVFSGVRDLQGNLAPEQTFHFFSFDLNKPVITFISPVPDTFPLISGVQYTLKLTLTNTDGTPATDVSRVDYFRMDGATQTFLFTTTASPFSYTFVGPDVPQAGGTLTLRAIATDQSFNVSEPANITWQVQPNKPPQSVAITLTPTSAYASNRVNTAVTFTDEGTFATVQIDAAGTQADGFAWNSSQVKNLTRSTVDSPWPPVSLDFDLPATLQEGTTVTFTSTVTDVRGQKGTASAPLSVLTDAVKPLIFSTLPAGETRYTIGAKYQIEAVVGDNESGVRDVTFAFDNQVIKVLPNNTAKVTPGTQPHTWKYVSGQVTVPAKNIDTRIPIVITVTDYHGNATVSTVEVVYVGVNDPTLPKGAWLCPIDHATFPASTNLPVTLQVRATDDIAVTGVKFVIPGVTTPVTASRVGTTDTYQATVTLATPAPDTLYTLTAIISDADPLHDVELTTTLDFVAVDLTIDERTQAVVASDVATFQNKSIVVKGASAHFVPHVPLTLKNLIVLNGAKVETLASTTGIEQKLDLTISDHLYVDCASSIDVSARGYLGGWGVNADGSNTKNNDARGLTLGNSPVNGPTSGASASHAGLGGERNGGQTNATYGSVTAPFDLGTGGAGNSTCCTAGGQGGGAVRILAGTQPSDLGLFSIAGSVNANGGTGSGIAEAGSGGSVNIGGRQFVVGPNGRVSANGGDDDAVDQVSRGAGGGRIAITASDRFSVDTMGLQVQARGGRNNTSTETASFLDGGAGTIFTKLPGETTGGLYVSSFDERAATSVHLTRPTPLAAITVDRLELGARALLRADDTLTIGSTTNDRSAATIAPTAVLVLPNDQPTITVTPAQPAGSTLTQGFTLNTGYSAVSPAGIGSATVIWTPVTPNRVDSYLSYPATASQSAITLAIPNNSPASATLTVTATDRAGRTGSSAALAYTIVANQPPIIDKFLVVPTSLYPGKSIAVTVSAHDEVAVTKLTLTSVINNGTPAVQTKTPNTAVVTDTVFTPITVPITTPGDVPMTLTLSAEDAYPGNTPRTQTVPVTILKDVIAPALTVTQPVANTVYNEGSGNTIPIRITASDAEVAIKQAYYQIDGAAQIALTAGANNAYSADVPIPPVDGTDNVTKHIVITVTDYEGNPSTSDIAILIKPLNDVNAPVVALACPSPGALFPAGYGAKLRVFALGNNTGNAANGIQSVQFFINGSTTPINAAPVSGLANYYEATFTIPSDATAGTIFTMRAVVTNIASLSNDVATSFSVVAGTKLTVDTTIAANNTQYDNGTLIIQGGTTTIAGAHTFDTLVVLDGAKVTHAQGDKLAVSTTNALFVSCTGTIDASARGYLLNTTYPGATTPGTSTAGSHIGYGGLSTAPLASTFGSVYQPLEAGGGGRGAGAGGGVISIQAGSFVADGAIRANGDSNTCCEGGAGGSIWIRTQLFAGSGALEANGGNQQRTGGGGAVSIEYTSGAPNPTAWTGGNNGATGGQYGGAGSLYLKGPNATYGSLTINDNNHGGSQATELPSLGGGIVQSGSGGATLVTDRAANIPPYFGNHWVEIRDASGVFKGLYRIASINAKTATLAANGSDTPNVAATDQWRGVYRFDAVTIAATESLISIDPILIGANRLQTVYGTTAANAFVTYTQPISGDDISIVGRVALPQVKAQTLAFENGAFVTSSSQTLALDVTNSVNVKSGATIDLTARGFAVNTTYSGATTPGTSTAGSHIGYGGLNTTPLASTFGSIFQPLEPGGGGRGAGVGGGVLSINTASFTNDGSIRANGESNTCCEGGAGGSIWIRTQSFAGSGALEANGGNQQRTGGGGAVSIEYATGTPNPTAWAGGNANATGGNVGGAGTILLKASGATFGALTINNNGHGPTAQATELPSLGIGTAQSGSSGATLITNRATNIPLYFANHWVTVRGADGTLKGKWRIATINAKTMTLAPNGAETINIQSGDSYRGTYRLDSLKLRSAKLRVEDLLEVTATPDLDAASSIAGNNLGAPSLVASLVSLGSNATGSSVIGTAGAVSDPDAPITLIATNTVSNNSYTGTANADGSFTVPVQGNAGDTITLKAKDGNLYPLESPVINLGQLTVSTPTASQIPRGDWTTDASFRARVLASDGSRLLVSSNSGSGSDKLVILSITDPVHPSLVRTVVLNNGPITDIAIANNYAFITANDFITLDLSNPASTPVIANDAGNTEYSVVVTNGYAFTTTPHFTSGRIRIYDVSTPSIPRLLRDQTSISGVDFTGIAAYGTNYLVAFSPNKTSGGSVGHDVVIFDRTDINNFGTQIGDVDIPGFDANNGRVIGSKVYVTSLASPDVWVVDLANPASPAILGKVTVGGNSSGVSSIKNDLFVAAGAAGLVDVDVTNPATPAIAGAFTTTGTAYDVALQSPYAYVANDNGLAVVPISTAPQVEASRVSMSLQGATLVITGGSRAITGGGAITVAATDATANTTSTSQPVASDGTFSISFGASAGDAVSIEATDASGRKSGSVSLGVVPFGSGVTFIPILPAISETNFHPRSMAVEGNTLIVGGWQDGGTTKAVTFDVTDPSAPVYKRTLTLSNGAVNDVNLRNNYALVNGDDLAVVDLSNPTSTPVVFGDGNTDYQGVLSGGYLFIATPHFTTGMIRIYDVSNPAATRFLRDQSTVSGIDFRSFATYGANYLIGFSPNKTSGGTIGHDVVIFDKSNINNLIRIGNPGNNNSDLDIPNFDAFRGKVVGKTLYVAGTNGGVAVVDISDLTHPIVKTIIPAAEANAVDFSGTVGAIADGSAGVTFLDTTNPNAPVVTGTVPVGGSAWSVLFNRGNLYVANEQGIVVIKNLATSPLVAPSLITITPTSGTTATISGAAGSVTGVTPLTIEVKNSRGGAFVSGQSLAADGTFSILLPASVGDPITVEATDPAGRKSGPISVGVVPFGSAVTQTIIGTTVSGEPFYKTRTLSTDGTNLLVGSYNDAGSTRALLYDVTDPATPAFRKTFTFGSGAVNDVLIHKGWAYVAADDLQAIDLANINAAPLVFTEGNSETALLASGGYLFSASPHNTSGTIRIRDISNPAAPRFLRDQTYLSGIDFQGLAAIGDNYIAAFSSSRTSGGSVGHDLVIFDKSNIFAFFKVADMDIGGAAFSGFRGKVVGNTLYIAGQTGGVAVVDVTDPANPVFQKIMATAGTAFGTGGSGNLVAIADGGAGVTFVDGSNPANPQIIGTQPVGGTAFSLVFNRGNIYVANEQGVAVIRNVGTAPIITSSLVTISSDGVGHATVTGGASAVTGTGSLLLDVKNTRSVAAVSGASVAGDGSFSVTLDALPGDGVTVEATDAAGRKSGAVYVGTVPFGSSIGTVIVPTSQTQVNFHPRTIATDGKFAVVGGYNDSGTTKVAIYDVTNPANPVFQRAVAPNDGPVDAVGISNGYAVIAADDLTLLDLNNPASTPVVLPDAGNTETDVVVSSNGLVFTTTPHFTQGRVRVYDISNPTAPFVVRDEVTVSGANFTGLTAFGEDYLIGTGAGHDVVVIDRRDPDAMTVVKDFDVPAFTGFRGKVVGNTFYLAGSSFGVAVIDLTDPKSPVLKTILQTTGDAYGIDAAGSTLAVADGTAGVSFLDITNPVAPQFLGTQVTGGWVFSTVFNRGNLYAVNDQGLVVIRNVVTSPIVDGTLLSIANDGSGNVTVSGAAGAVTGIAPLTFALKNVTSNITTSSAAVAANGSFSAAIAAVSGHALSLLTGDGGQRSGSLPLGQVPFGTVTTYHASSLQASNDTSYRARRIAVSSTYAALTTGSTTSYISNPIPASRRLLAFELATGTVRSYINNLGPINDVAIQNGFAFIASDDFESINVASAMATAVSAADQSNTESSIAIAGNYAFTCSPDFTTGMLRLYDISNPAAPVFFRQQATISGVSFVKLARISATQIVAVTPDQTSGNTVGHDVVIFDISNPSSLVKLGEKDIDGTNFRAIDVAADGNTLYVAGGDVGIAIVDITNPASPVVKSIINTPGNARGVALSGTNEIAVADGAGGITFVDTTDRSNPVIKGTQQVPGNSTGVAVTGKSVYTASERYFNVINRP